MISPASAIRKMRAFRDDEPPNSLGHLRELVPEEAKTWCAPHFLVEMGVPTDKILEVAHRIHAGLIVLGVYTREGVPGAATHLPIATFTT
jgi:nucleotide-binding universal stress UspA family protein